jgi:phage-related protein
MALDVFSWRPTSDLTATQKFTTSSAVFGDGYEQRAANGINGKAGSWPLTFTGTRAEMEVLTDFLDLKGCHTIFAWQRPSGKTVSVRMDDGYQEKEGGGNTMTITVTFKQAITP